MKYSPEVFIIESLDPDDEGNGRMEGAIVSHILRLHEKQPKYRYVRTQIEFKHAVKEFEKSGYRYLHISAHANEEGICTTNLDEISYLELAEMLQGALSGRRLFLSACSVMHDRLAKAMLDGTGCYSVIGPTEDIAFTDAAAVWTALYHMLFTKDSSKISHLQLKKSLVGIRDLFEVKLGFYSRSKKLKRGYTNDLMS